MDLPPHGSAASVSASHGVVDQPLLQALSRIHPNSAHALAEVAALRASLALPARTIHIVSDVHGEHAKLRHVINNASGALRPAVASLLNSSLTEAEQRELLALIYYPSELIAARKAHIVDSGQRRPWVRRMLTLLFDLVRNLARSWRREQLNALLPPEFRELFKELLWEPMGLRPPAFLEGMIAAYEHHDRDFSAVRAAARLVRNLTAHEIIVAGDLGDRGPRIDKVIDLLLTQPHVRIVWGNHDAHWLGACLGHEACIASVLRFSLRYRRLAQLEEGYGILLTELERLATTVYRDDPAHHFTVKGKGEGSGGGSGPDDLLLARMQKAITVIQLKLEGQLIARHPEWNLGHRDVLSNIDLSAGTVRLGQRLIPLTDAHLPTLDTREPNRLSDAERGCMDAFRSSFSSSPRLWEHMKFVVGHGSMYLRRDDLLIFHACVPVDPDGTPQVLRLQGRDYSGRELFEALSSVVRRSFRLAEGVSSQQDLQEAGDALWYLWCGPRSPLFGKDKIATFETYFVEDETLKTEKKNPYFELLHDPVFVRRIGKLFDCDENVLVVNGHVPVKLEKGEQAVKRGGNAVTIDGAFAEAYGDHGYTLLLGPSGVTLAEHSHFESVDAVIRDGKDMLPNITSLRRYDPPRRVADTQTGHETREAIRNLEELIAAYQRGNLIEQAGT